MHKAMGFALWVLQPNIKDSWIELLSCMFGYCLSELAEFGWVTS